jgi:hypothetical protein
MPAASYQRTPEAEMPARLASVEIFIGSQAKPYSHCKVKSFERTSGRR